MTAETPPTPVSMRFRNMAESIDHNDGRMPFAGACVIVPPQDGGDPVEVLLLDRKADPAQFWATVLSRVQMQINALNDAQARGNIVRKY